MTDYSDLALPVIGDDYTLKLGSLIALGWDTDKRLGLDAYPLYDESRRSDLNHKIAAHYALREIGRETPEMWAFAMRRKMGEIMPYYNQLYKSELLKVNPMSTADMTVTSDNTSDAKSSGKTTGDTTSSSDTKGTTDSHNRQRTVDSQTPDAVLSNTGDYASAVNDVDATNHATSDAQTTASSHNQNVTDFTSQQSTGKGTTTSKGYSGISEPQLLQQWRESMLNIDMMVINDLGDLFMAVADTMDSMAPNNFRRVALW